MVVGMAVTGMGNVVFVVVVSHLLSAVLISLVLWLLLHTQNIKRYNTESSI